MINKIDAWGLTILSMFFYSRIGFALLDRGYTEGAGIWFGLSFFILITLLSFLWINIFEKKEVKKR